MQTTKRYLVAFLVVLALLLPAAARSSEYTISEGDLLQISVWGVDRLNFSARVRPDGMITVPGLGDLTASNLKPRELQKLLTERLKSLVKNPIVTVTVGEIANSKVYIFGAGVKSGIYELNRKTSLLQILCSLSDLKNADLRRAYLTRKGKKIKENFYPLFIEGELKEDLDIESNDAIFIPLWQDKSVYVLGAVNAPKAVEYRDGMTVMEVILEAGGFNKFAGLNATRIVRREQGKESVIEVKAKKLLEKADLSQNVKLRPGDYVIVEESMF